MAIPVSKLDVINMALNHIGRLPVIQDTDSQDAQIISLRIDVLLPVLLRTARWNFAIKYVSDNTPNTLPFSPDYQFAYTLPFDFGQFCNLSTNCFPLSYRFVDGLLLTSIRPISYYYVVNTVDFDAITTMFYYALSLFVASDVCMVLTKDKELTDWLKIRHEESKSDAILQNDMERYIQTTPSNDFDRQSYI